MSIPTELPTEDCRKLLESRTFGRLAFQTPTGPRIVPLNYRVAEDSIVVRTTFYSELGTYGAGFDAAFEVDEVDVVNHSGWSVVVVGRLAGVENGEDLSALREDRDPDPWAGGPRYRYLLLSLREVTGRRLASSTVTA